MTPRQRQCLDFIIAYIEGTGIGPSYREIGGALSVATSGAHRLAQALIGQGYLKCDLGAFGASAKRGLRLSEKSLAEAGNFDVKWAINICRENGYEVYKAEGSAIGTGRGDQRGYDTLVAAKET